ncbi:MAG: LysM peptidoglycan-binding domain-containing protein [Clostridia bacterium]|nr:LysM peptidoglycan-binding domain-containing protein [Clostridia bacterium]
MEIIDCNLDEFVWYQVQKHDTLNSILSKFNATSNCLIRNNPNIDLYEGEMVKIVKQCTITHIVKPMETLDYIAQRYNTSVEKLISLNNLSSKRLFVGQTILVNNK